MQEVERVGLRELNRSKGISAVVRAAREAGLSIITYHGETSALVIPTDEGSLELLRRFLQRQLTIEQDSRDPGIDRFVEMLKAAVVKQERSVRTGRRRQQSNVVA